MFKKIALLAGLIFPAFLVFIGLFLAWKNYVPGMHLLGWDSLHSEFNFSLAFKRAIFGVWREEQGIGAIAAHAHMADVPRIFLLWLSSFVLPTSFLRYFYIFLCLILGPLGVYFFLKYIFEIEGGGLPTRLASFLGALYYLLNLGTLQHFFVAFEMFTTQFAFFPWLFYSLLKVLREGKRGSYSLFLIFSLLALPMAYAPALFYAYFGGAFLFIFFYFVFSKFRLGVAKRGLVLVFLILSINSFWLLPNLYSIKNQATVIANARINRLFSPEAFIRNEQFGRLENVLIHKSFLFDWRVFDFESNTYGDLMAIWNDHLALRSVLWIGYGALAISILGFLITLFARNKVGICLSVIGFLCLFFLVNTNYPTSFFYKYLYDHFSLFREGFRMPFTKFSIIFEFVMAFFFGYFFLKIFSFSRRAIFKFLSVMVSVIVLVLLAYFMLPAFQGNFISEVVRTQVPTEYLKIFDWFKGKEGRVAILPLQTQWGWEYHNWKYEGSGFISFGINNPILTRDFDRWSPHNESFYNEASFALYANDKEAFARTLEKYQIRYLLFDESILNAGGSSKLLFIPEIKETLAAVGAREVAKFGFLTIFESAGGPPSELVYAPETFVRVDADLTYSQVDPVYRNYGDYIYDSAATPGPFVNLDKRAGVTIGLQPSLTGQIWLKFENEKLGAKAILPIENIISEDFSQNRGFPEGYNCDIKKAGTISKEIRNKAIIYKAEGGGVSCDFLDYPELSYSQAYVLRIRGENKSGRSLKIYLQNASTGRMDLEELLPKGEFDEYYAILPRPNLAGSGYTLNLETRSFGRVASENILDTVEIIPFKTFKGSSLQGVYSVENNLAIKAVKKIGPVFYRIDIKQESKQTGEPGLLVLGQGYEPGWSAFAVGQSQSGQSKSGAGLNRFQRILSDFRLLEHARVNSWANGWLVQLSETEGRKPRADGQTIIIVFWPQLLEYLGFLGVALGAIWVIFLTKGNSNPKI